MAGSGSGWICLHAMTTRRRLPAPAVQAEAAHPAPPAAAASLCSVSPSWPEQHTCRAAPHHQHLRRHPVPVPPPARSAPLPARPAALQAAAGPAASWPSKPAAQQPVAAPLAMRWQHAARPDTQTRRRCRCERPPARHLPPLGVPAVCQANGGGRRIAQSARRSQPCAGGGQWRRCWRSAAIGSEAWTAVSCWLQQLLKRVLATSHGLVEARKPTVVVVVPVVIVSS